MYALFTEVNAEDAHKEAGREMLNRIAVPGAKADGAKGGYWLEPKNGRGVSIVVFETEAEARGRRPVPGWAIARPGRPRGHHVPHRRGA